MKSYKWAKAVAIVSSALACAIVILTFIIRTDTVSEQKGTTLVAGVSDTAEKAVSITIKYKSLKDIVIKNEDDVKLAAQLFAQAKLTLSDEEYDEEGSIEILCGEEESIVLGFDETFRLVKYEDKVYSAEGLLNFRNFLVTATNRDKKNTTTTTTTTTTTAVGSTVASSETMTTTVLIETDKKVESDVYYSVKYFPFEWKGAEGNLAFSKQSDNQESVARDPKLYLPAKRISSKEELEALKDSLKAYYELDTSYYDEIYFKDKELVIILAEETGVCANYEIAGISLEKKKLEISLDGSIPPLSEAELKTRFVFLSVDKKDLKNVKTIQAIIVD